MKAYVLMWGDRVCSSGIAHTFVPKDPDIWFHVEEAQKLYAGYHVTTDFEECGWWLLELDL